jgi:hypothetical protein
VVKRLVRLAALVWIARWAALEAASWVGARRPSGPPPLESMRVPGRMPRRREPEDPNG